MRRKYLMLAAVLVVVAGAIGWWLYRSRVTHEVLFRASGEACKPNVTISIGFEGKLSTFTSEDHVDLPWQSKTYAQRRGSIADVIITGDSRCGALQCQLSIDGVDKDVKTATHQVHCGATVD